MQQAIGALVLLALMPSVSFSQPTEIDPNTVVVIRRSPALNRSEMIEIGVYKELGRDTVLVKLEAWNKKEVHCIVENVRKPEDAIKEFSKFIRAITEGGGDRDALAEFYFVRGVAWHGRQEYASAIEDFDESLRLRPKRARVYAQRGFALFEKQNVHLDRRQADTKQKLLASPVAKWAQILDEVTLAQDRLGIKAFSVGYYRNRVEPELAGIRAKSVYDASIDDFDSALRLDPDFALAFYRRGEIRFTKWTNRWDKIKADFDKAVEELDKKTEPKKDDPKKDDPKKDELKKDKIPSAKEAQAQLDDAKEKLTLREQDYVLAKTAWDLANKDLAQANRDYFKFAMGIFKRTDDDLRKAKNDWLIARDAYLAATRTLKGATEKEAAKKKKDEKSVTSLTAKFGALTEALRPFHVAKIDLTDALEDFRAAVRADHENAAFVADSRKQVHKRIADDQAVLDRYQKIEEDHNKRLKDIQNPEGE